MSWIADAGIASLALWAALLLTGVAAGMFAARWNQPAPPDRAAELVLLAAAGAGVVSLCAHAGAMVGSAAGNALLTAYVPIATDPGYRLAVLWSTLPGASLTLAVTLLVFAAIGVPRRAVTPSRSVTVLSVTALVALAVSAWFAPAREAVATSLPPFVQAPAAALAPAFALVSIIFLLAAVAARAAGSVTIRGALIASWVAATLAIVAEQMARSQLGIGPRDAIVFGSASSGLLLWLVTGAILHHRVQVMVLRMPRLPGSTRLGAWLAHVGAGCLIVSFGAHAFASRSNVSLPPGTAVSVTDAFRRPWQLANQGISRFDAEGVDVVSVAIEATKPSGATALLAPEIRDYHTPTGQHVENSVVLRRSTGTVTQAMRVLLVSTDSLDVAGVRITFLPFPMLWPVGVALLLLSAAVPRSQPTTPSPNE